MLTSNRKKEDRIKKEKWQKEWERDFQTYSTSGQLYTAAPG